MDRKAVEYPGNAVEQLKSLDSISREDGDVGITADYDRLSADKASYGYIDPWSDSNTVLVSPWQVLDKEPISDDSFHYADGSDIVNHDRAMVGQSSLLASDQYLFDDDPLGIPKDSYGEPTDELPMRDVVTEPSINDNISKHKSPTLPRNQRRNPLATERRAPNPRVRGEIRIGDVVALREFFQSRFEVLLVKTCKPIGAQIIDTICPFKTHDHPYWNHKRPDERQNPPSWWPRGFDYISPHHMRKPGLFDWLSYIVALPLTDYVSYQEILANRKDIPDWESLLGNNLDKALLPDAKYIQSNLEIQTPDDKRNEAKLKVIREVFHIAGKAARVADGEIDENMVVTHDSVPDGCFQRSIKGRIISDTSRKGRRIRSQNQADKSTNDKQGAWPLTDCQQWPSPEALQNRSRKRKRSPSSHQQLTDRGPTVAEIQADGSRRLSSSPLNFLNAPQSLLNDGYGMYTSFNRMQTNQGHEVALFPSMESPTTRVHGLGCSGQYTPLRLQHDNDTENRLKTYETRNKERLVIVSPPQSERSFDEQGEIHQEIELLHCSQCSLRATEYDALNMQVQPMLFAPQLFGYSWPFDTFPTVYPGS